MSKINLRDQFAMSASQGFLADGVVDHSYIAKNSYSLADRMIEEREKDNVFTQDEIKQMLVDAIRRKYGGMNNASTVIPVNHLIQMLEYGP
jgi:hypothetical protein